MIMKKNKQNEKLFGSRNKTFLNSTEAPSGERAVGPKTAELGEGPEKATITTGKVKND